MYAVINIPGSRHFEYHGPDTKKGCEEWLKSRVEDLRETELPTSILPRRILNNRTVESWRYLDGSKVVLPYAY